jgi:MFS family permease
MVNQISRAALVTGTLPARKRITLLALCLAAFIISLDVTIVNVALPALVRQTGATTTDLRWVVDSYNLATR